MSVDFKLTTIREDKDNKIERTYFGFEGGWNNHGQDLFLRIPCGNCGKKFTEEEIRDENYDIWVNRKVSWINYEPNLWWDRYLIEYKVKDLTPGKKEDDEERYVDKSGYSDFKDVNDFGDGKHLVLKVNFIITNLTHKKKCIEEEKEIEHGNKFKEGKVIFGKDIDKRTSFTVKVKKDKDGNLEMTDFKENKKDTNKKN